MLYPKGSEETTEYSDTELVGLAKSGNLDAFDELINRHRGRAFEWAKRVTADPHLAEDVVQDALIRGEIVQMIQELLHCLSRRERSVFEAHFFGELSPQEIAKLMDTTALNVYKLLSRSKQKMQLEKSHYISIQEYVAHKSHASEMTKVTLDRPQLMHTKYIHPDQQVAHYIYHALRYGLSGLAFKLLQAESPEDIRPNRAAKGSEHVWDVYAYVEVLENLYEELKSSGAIFAYELLIQEFDWGTWKEFAVKDPDGYVIGFGNKF